MSNKTAIFLTFFLATFLLNAASADNSNTNSPEQVIKEFYRSISFEAGSRPDLTNIRSLMADDGIILFISDTDGIQSTNVEDSIRIIHQKIDEIGFEDYGLQLIPAHIDCSITDGSAFCVTVVEASYPGIDATPLSSIDVTVLEVMDGRWYATNSAFFVKAPEVRPPSILSYPVVYDAETPRGDRIWDHPLPFLGQKVIDLGYDLPNPFGVSVIPALLRQDLILRDLAISVNDGPVKEIDFVDFGTPSVENSTVQLKFDAWLFPFLNAYATVGVVDGKAYVPLTIQGSDLMDYLGLGGQCNGGVLEPDLCNRTLSAEATPDYYGENVALGITLATGWRNMFVAIPITYAWTNVNIIDTTVEALNVSPRIGVNSDIGDWGAMSTYIGATYLDAEIDLTGSVTFDTSDSGVPGLEDTTTVEYVINQENKDKWNYLIGFNWDINRSFSVQAEGGFGGSRSGLISSLTYRF